MSTNWIDKSRKTWTTTSASDHECSHDECRSGALQRIADACETMALDRARLEADRNYYKLLSGEHYDETIRLSRSNAALRGVITKLKRQLENMK